MRISLTDECLLGRLRGLSRVRLLLETMDQTGELSSPRQWLEEECSSVLACSYILPTAGMVVGCPQRGRCRRRRLRTDERERERET